jgi:hypothetical protein
MTDGRGSQEPQVYRIRVAGILDEAWSDWFDGLTISEQGDESLLTGPVRDQSALHGILVRIRDLGLPLLSIRCVPEKPQEDG